MHFLLNQRKIESAQASFLSVGAGECVTAFFADMPNYQPTALHALDALAKEIGVGKIYLKDESTRCGLNAFKFLGAAYAMGIEIAKRGGMEGDLSFARILSSDFVKRSEKITFVTATDGNHGRAVAHAAKLFGQKAIVYLPAGSSRERWENILSEGAEAEITPWNYDDTVRFAASVAEKRNGVLIQDTAFGSYLEIPKHIMQGYTMLLAEALGQMAEQPTHAFFQAGVGSFAGAMVGSLRERGNKTFCTIVEPTAADCLYRSAQNPKGEPETVKGEMKTVMAGLACGEPSSVGWDILRRSADAFCAIEEEEDMRAVRRLAFPFAPDPTVESGESGAAGLGALLAMSKKEREAIGLNASSVVLLVSTEGATDRENYDRILRETFR